MPLTRCKSLCVTGKCRRRKACTCKCGPLAAIHPALEDGCIKACNSPTRPEDLRDYECNFMNPGTAWQQYGYQACGYTFEDSPEAKIRDKELQETEEAETRMWERITPILGLVGVLLFAGGMALLFGKD